MKIESEINVTVELTGEEIAQILSEVVMEKAKDALPNVNLDGSFTVKPRFSYIPPCTATYKAKEPEAEPATEAANAA